MATNPTPANMNTIDGVKNVSIAIGGMCVTDVSVELAEANVEKKNRSKLHSLNNSTFMKT